MVFKTTAFDHSAISPMGGKGKSDSHTPKQVRQKEVHYL